MNRVRVEGLSALLGDLRKLGDKGEDAVKETVREIATETHRIAVASIVPAAGPSAPGQPPHSHTGELGKSVQMIITESGERIRAKVGSDLLKAYFLELGRKNAAARPFLLPAFEESTGRAGGLLKDKFEAKL